jgi:hypothetical protein
MCPWCDDPNSKDYDCYQHCKCVCHAIAEGIYDVEYEYPAELQED